MLHLCVFLLLTCGNPDVDATTTQAPPVDNDVVDPDPVKNTTTALPATSENVSTGIDNSGEIFYQLTYEIVTSAMTPVLQGLHQNTRDKVLSELELKLEHVVNNISTDLGRILTENRDSSCEQQLASLLASQRQLQESVTQKLETVERNQENMMNWMQSWLINCPQDWTRVGDRCFHMTAETTTGDGGDAFCRQAHRRAALASIHSRTEDDVLLSLLRAREKSVALIGLHRSDRASGGWAWSDGSPFDYVNWAPGEPNNIGRKEACSNKYNSGEKTGWNDLRCETVYPAICAFNLR